MEVTYEALKAVGGFLSDLVLGLIALVVMTISLWICFAAGLVIRFVGLLVPPVGRWWLDFVKKHMPNLPT